MYKDSDKEEAALKQWLEEHGVTVNEVDDVEFRKLMFKALNRQDKPRRFEVHFSDLIYCLRAAWFYKVCPQEFTEDGYGRYHHWMRGKGFELGVVNLLKGMLGGEIETQKIVRLGKAVGSVDMQFQDTPYELTTRSFYGTAKNPRIHPPFDKVMQDLTYMVAQNKSDGKVKVYIMMPPKETVNVRMNGFRGDIQKEVERTERTWEIGASEGGIKYFRREFAHRSNLLWKSLMTGRWSFLPLAYFKWRCENCRVEYEEGKVSICKYMELNRNLMQDCWKQWAVDKEKYLIEKYRELVKRAGTPEVFEDVYDRRPSPFELERWKEFLQMTYDAFMHEEVPDADGV